MSQARTYGAGKQRSQGFCAIASRHCPRTARTCSPPHPPPASAPLALAARPAHLLVSAPTSYIARAVATGLHPHPPSFAPPFLPRSLCAPHICTARATSLARTRPPHCTCSHRTHIARTVLRHRRALPVPDSARLLAEVLKLQGLSFCQSISNFVVGFLNLSKKDVKGLLFRK